MECDEGLQLEKVDLSGELGTLKLLLGCASSIASGAEVATGEEGKPRASGNSRGGFVWLLYVVYACLCMSMRHMLRLLRMLLFCTL